MKGRSSDRVGSRLDGYRGMIAVLALVALVLLTSLTGVLPRLVCAVDRGTCSSSSQSSEVGTPSDATTAPSGIVLPTPSGAATGSAELPVATDELAVSTVPGEGTVPAGRGRTVGAQYAPAPAGAAPVVGGLWGDEADSENTIDPERLVEVSALSCGAPGTGPCDAWEGLQTDTGAALAAGPTRLTQAGLDPFVGQEEATTVVDATLGSATSIGGEQTEVLYRSIQRTRDGALTESWTWQEGTSLRQVLTRRSREGVLSSVTIVGIDTTDTGTFLVRTEIPVTDSSADVMEDWLAALPADRSAAGTMVGDISGAPDLSAPAAVRAAFRTGVVQRSSIEVTETLTAQTLRDYPDGSLPGVTVLASWDLGLPNERGNRTWTTVEAS